MHRPETGLKKIDVKPDLGNAFDDLCALSQACLWTAGVNQDRGAPLAPLLPVPDLRISMSKSLCPKSVC